MASLTITLKTHVRKFSEAEYRQERSQMDADGELAESWGARRVRSMDEKAHQAGGRRGSLHGEIDYTYSFSLNTSIFDLI